MNRNRKEGNRKLNIGKLLRIYIFLTLPICHLLALLGVHFLHVSRIRVKSLTLRLLMSLIYIYIYIWSTYS